MKSVLVFLHTSFMVFVSVTVLAADPAETFAVRKAKAAERGLAWLERVQKANGSWSNEGFPALTALPVQAFIGNSGLSRTQVLEKAESFILSNVQPDGGIYRKSIIPGRGGLSTFNTAICMTALFMIDDTGNRSVIQDARSFLSGAQLSGDENQGGFGYSGPGFFSSADMMNTSYALEAMKITEKVEDFRPDGGKRAVLNMEQALRFVESLQNKSFTGDDAGGFFYKPGNSAAGTRKDEQGKVIFRSYGTMTYLGLLSMTYLDLKRDDSRVMSALDWASKHWSLDENPGLGNQGMFFFYHVLTRALSASGVEHIEAEGAGKAVDWKREVAEKILALQNDDGSWFNKNGRYWEADPVLVTAYCLIALANVR